MRDKKRKQLAMLEEAYSKVNENLGPAAQTASIGAQGPIIAGDEEICGGSVDIATIAAQAIAAIAQLASAAGANISVAVEIGEEEIEEVEVVDQFNTGYEDVGST